MVFTSPHMRTIIKPTTNKRGAFERQTDTGRRPPPKGENNEPLPHYIRHPRQRNRDHQHHRAQRDRFSNDLDKARDEIAAIKAELTDAQNRRIEAEASYNSLVDRTTAAEARAEAAEDEIVTLKAKLYDYITAGA